MSAKKDVAKSEDLGVDVSQCDKDGNDLVKSVEPTRLPEIVEKSATLSSDSRVVSEFQQQAFAAGLPAFAGEFTEEAYAAHFNEILTAAMDKYRAARSDGKVTLSELFSLVGDIGAAGLFIFEALYGTGITDETNAKFNEVVEAAYAAFDANVVPVDFPVNDLVERFMENQVRQQIRPLLEAVRDYVRRTLVG